jgi:hypothetical protein
MPDKPAPDVTPPPSRLAASTSAPRPPAPVSSIDRTHSAVRHQTLDGNLPIARTDVEAPPEVQIWGPPQSKTTWSLRVPTRWHRWVKAWMGFNQTSYGLPEGLLPAVIARHVARHKDDILREALEEMRGTEE